ncbi:MAG: hypothetical protein AB7P31_00265 [Steroidobacteraceae bacterium]
MPTLQCHGDCAGSPIERIEATLDLTSVAGQAIVTARFRLLGDCSRIAIPPRGSVRREDGLWRHTCFEFFLRSRAAAGYVEVNLAPSAEWAAYAFSGNRAGMRPIEAAAPAIDVSVSDCALALDASLPLAALADPAATSYEAALSAVIESREGTLSYWALVHPDPLRPDFHHPGSFVHEIRH